MSMPTFMSIPIHHMFYLAFRAECDLLEYHAKERRRLIQVAREDAAKKVRVRAASWADEDDSEYDFTAPLVFQEEENKMDLSD